MAKGSMYEGKTLEDATRRGLEELGLARAEATITVIEEGKGGFLGFGARPFRVSVTRRPGGAIREPEEQRRGAAGGTERGRERGGRDRDRSRGGRGGERTGAPQAGGRDRDRPKGGRPERTTEERPVRAERAERPAGEERPSRGDRGDRPDRAERPDRGDRGERPDRGDRAQQPRREERPRPQAQPAASAPVPPNVANEGDEDSESMRKRRRRGRRGGRGRRRGPGAPEEVANTNGSSSPRTETPSMGASPAAERVAEPMREPVREPAMASVTPVVLPLAPAPMPQPTAHMSPPPSFEPARPTLAPAAQSSEPSFSDVELAATAKRLTEELLKAMGFEVTTSARTDGNRVDVTVEVARDEELLNGSKGETRQALQHLLNRFINRGDSSRYHLQLEINDFWQRREQELADLATKLAAEALASNSEQVTEYLNSQERRIVHVTLKEDTRVKTYALGTGMVKRVAIAPADFPERTEDDSEG